MKAWRKERVSWVGPRCSLKIKPKKACPFFSLQKRVLEEKLQLAQKQWVLQQVGSLTLLCLEMIRYLWEAGPQALAKQGRWEITAGGRQARSFR